MIKMVAAVDNYKRFIKKNRKAFVSLEKLDSILTNGTNTFENRDILALKCE